MTEGHTTGTLQPPLAGDAAAKHKTASLEVTIPRPAAPANVDLTVRASGSARKPATAQKTSGSSNLAQPQVETEAAHDPKRLVANIQSAMAELGALHGDPDAVELGADALRMLGQRLLEAGLDVLELASDVDAELATTAQESTRNDA